MDPDTFLDDITETSTDAIDDPMFFISENYMIFLMVFSIIAIIWSINRFFRKASKESKLLHWIAATLELQ